MATEPNVLEKVVEKTVVHDSQGKIMKVIERHLAPEPPSPKPEPGPDPARLLELEADSAMLHALEGLARQALEVVEHPETLAKTSTQSIQITIGHFGGAATTYDEKSRALGTRFESSAVSKVLAATARWAGVKIVLDGAPSTDAVARPARPGRITPTRHMGFWAAAANEENEEA